MNHRCNCPATHNHGSFEGVSYGYTWCKEAGCKCRFNHTPQHFLDKLAQATTITIHADGTRSVTKGAA